MNNNQEFLHIFNDIEKRLRKDIGASNGVNFYRLLQDNARKNKLVKQYRNELETMGDLRNIIAHGNIRSPFALATEGTIERIGFIRKQLINPTKICDIFSKEVTGVKQDESLGNVLKIVNKRKYSQFPVINEEGFSGLITENGITNWLARNVKEDIISIKETTVEDVIEDEEENESYGILYSQDTLYDVLEKFEEEDHTGTRTFIIVVINSPKKKVRLEDIYTILTPWDLDLIYSELGLEV